MEHIDDTLIASIRYCSLKPRVCRGIKFLFRVCDLSTFNLFYANQFDMPTCLFNINVGTNFKLWYHHMHSHFAHIINV